MVLSKTKNYEITKGFFFAGVVKC